MNPSQCNTGSFLKGTGSKRLYSTIQKVGFLFCFFEKIYTFILDIKLIQSDSKDFQLNSIL